MKSLGNINDLEKERIKLLHNGCLNNDCNNDEEECDGDTEACNDYYDCEDACEDACDFVCQGEYPH